MLTLPRVLADGVLEALRALDHVVVAPESRDALCKEVEAIIAPKLGAITPHLGVELEVRGEVTTTFGHERADEAVEAMVGLITERLMSSDHVDDIFAEDHVIRRDAFRAIRDILLGYIRGVVAVDDRPEDRFEVPLASLGYLVEAVSRRLDEDLLRDALERSAASVGGSLLVLDVATNVASFDVPGGAALGRLAVEEAITQHLGALAHADLVELPRIEQVLELAAGSARVPGFEDALQRSEARVRRLCGCVATCTIIDDRTVVATLTPLSEDSAQSAEEHFSLFLSVLEGELAGLDGAIPSSGQRARSTEPPPTTKRATARARESRKSSPASMRARKAPAGRESGTRERERRAKRRAKG
jgi:hypothetical protein